MKPEINDKELIKAQDELIAELSKELRRICKKNLKLKEHMKILVGTPNCRTAEKIRQEGGSEKLFSESIINLN